NVAYCITFVIPYYFLYASIIHVVPSVAVGERLPNCGLPTACGPESFSAHLFTGVDHHDQPKVCVDGKYIVGEGLNNGGRGINMVVLDTVNKHLQRVVRFDTYQEDSSLLESLLLNLRAGDIVLLVTFDEPTKKYGMFSGSHNEEC
ncbi:protein FAM3A-like, partial [Tropilaelaps mercedesae]